MTAYSSERPGDPFFIVIHTGEGILDADDMARYLDNNPRASAHAAADWEKVREDLVPDNRAAWTAGPTANSWGLHIELCAFAQMTREEWLSEKDVKIFVPWIGASGEWRTIRKPRQMLRNAAAWVRKKADKFGINIRRIYAADLRADKDGICGHADTSEAWGETDHTDPGKYFPFDIFIQMVLGNEQKEEEDDMFSPGDRTTLQEIWAALEALAQGRGERSIEPKKGEELKQVKHWYELQHNLRNFLGLRPRGDYTKDQQGPLPAPGQDYEAVKLLKRLDTFMTDTSSRLTAIEKRIGLTNHESPISEVKGP